MDDSVKLIYQTTASITPPHEYFQFSNFSGDSLPVRWKVNQALTYYPSQWSIALQDNETYHNPMIDSNDIVIPDTTGAMDKIVINIYHNQQAGYGELVIDLINLDSIAEIHTIKFEIEIIQANSITETLLNQIHLYPNPTSDILNIEIPYVLFSFLEIVDFSGKIMAINQFQPNENLNQVKVENFNNGVYFVRFTTDNKERITIPFLKQ